MIAAALALTLAAAPAPTPAPVVAPRLTIASFAALPQPLPLPYRQSGNATARIAAATTRARRTGKKLLIDFGADWCVYCRLFAATIALPELRTFVARHFELVAVDMGDGTRNRAVQRRYGLHSDGGLPVVVIVDPATGRPLTTTRPWARAETDLIRPQAIADWLAKAAQDR